MSASPGDQQPRQATSRAAELAAQQVEQIVAVAQASAEKLTSAAKEEAASVRALARESAQEEVETAQREASARIREAQAAADDVLAEAKAVSGGMRQLAHLLTTHAERILRDVQNSHRAISADLRAAGGKPDAAPRSSEPSEPRPARRAPLADDNPLADLEPPVWVEESSR
jgi:cell division septum initiation protein DivIVA